jgi:hypothetical protein
MKINCAFVTVIAINYLFFYLTIGNRLVTILKVFVKFLKTNSKNALKQLQACTEKNTVLFELDKK